MNDMSLSSINGLTNTRELEINLSRATKRNPDQKVFKRELKILILVMTGSPSDAFVIAFFFSFSTVGIQTLLNFVKIKLVLLFRSKAHISSNFKDCLWPLKINPLNHQKVILDKNEAQFLGHSFYNNNKFFQLNFNNYFNIT
jgi:hypothetical protein